MLILAISLEFLSPRPCTLRLQFLEGHLALIKRFYFSLVSTGIPLRTIEGYAEASAAGAFVTPPRISRGILTGEASSPRLRAPSTVALGRPRFCKVLANLLK